MPDPGFTIRKARANKSLRVTWVDGKTNLDVEFYAKGPEKCQVTVQHDRLPDTVGVMASDENILVIKDYQTPKFVFDCMGLMVIPGWDLGDGHEGPGIKIGRNSNVTNQGAGYLSLTDKAGTVYYLWVDATGDLRIHTAAPVTTNDLAGTVVGAQS